MMKRVLALLIICLLAFPALAQAVALLCPQRLCRPDTGLEQTLSLQTQAVTGVSLQRFPERC